MGRCQGNSPGPVYMLPPTIGYNKHDNTRYRNPMYSLSPRLPGPGCKDVSPGPQYEIRNLTNYGKVYTPAYSIKSRGAHCGTFATPGPGAYSPEKKTDFSHSRPPCYSMQRRPKFADCNYGPGPAYGLPSTIGTRVPNKYSSAAYTIIGRNFLRKGDTCSPGPANYQSVETCVFKQCPPKFTMPHKIVQGPCERCSPGPAAYFPKKLCGEKGIAYTMSPKYHECYVPYITPEDDVPCIPDKE